MGKIPILTHIFQMGWFNHQPETDANWFRQVANLWPESPAYDGCWPNAYMKKDGPSLAISHSAYLALYPQLPIYFRPFIEVLTPFITIVVGPIL